MRRAPRSGSRCRRQGPCRAGGGRSAGCAAPGNSSSRSSFSSLTRRIVSLNLAGLVALVASILYLSQFRAGLIEARTQSLLVYAEIISEAIATSATVEGNIVTLDPDRLLDLKPGESYGVPDEYSDFPDQSGTRRPGAAPPDRADQDARPHFRSRRRPDPRQPQSVCAAATCCGSNCRRHRPTSPTSSSAR